MKYLKRYSLFVEKVEVEQTDSASEKVSKEQVNNIEEWQSKYNQNKTAIDNLYDPNKKITEEERKAKLEQLEVEGNPFLEEYVKVKDLEYSLFSKNDEQANQMVRKSELQRKLPTVTTEASRKNTELEIRELNNSIAMKNQEIADIKKKILDAESEMKKKFEELRAEFEENTKKIQEEDKKLPTEKKK